MALSNSHPPMVMKESDVTAILEEVGPANFLGQGAAGIVYRFQYYQIPAVVKIPVRADKKESLKREIVNYSYLCKTFNACSCRQNIVQMLGYDMKNAVIMLEYFDGSDLIKYVGYPMHESTFYTHRLLPRSTPGIKDSAVDRPQFDLVAGTADFTTLGTYLGTSSSETTIWVLFDKIYTGLLCLHGTGLLHKDMELKNVLIRSDGKVGITDLGNSRIITRDVFEYGFVSMFEGFKTDLDTVGPMMGNFLDSSNPSPYQYRLDTGTVNNAAILNAIQNANYNHHAKHDDGSSRIHSILTNLKDAFLVLTTFKDLIGFISFMYFLNRHMDRDTGLSMITEAASEMNDTIDTEVSEEVSALYVTPDHIEVMMNQVYDPLMEAGISELVRYFRAVVQHILIAEGMSTSLGNTSVHDYLLHEFEDNYPEAMATLVNQIRYGFLLKHFDLFHEIFQTQ